MDWMASINKFIREQSHRALAPAAFMGVMTFLGNFFIALSDGELDGTELHQLLSGANGLESVLLIVIMVALKRKNDSK